MHREFAAGAALFHEGDASETAYLIKSGTVTVLKERKGSQLVLGHVGAGEFLGEMGVVEELPRSATALAETAVEADVFDKATFLDLVCGDSNLAFNLIHRLSMRLRDVDDRLAALLPIGAARPPSPGAAAARGRETRLPVIRGGSYALQMYIGPDPITVERLPYTVGRVEDGAPAGRASEPDLGILDPAPYRLSPTHFTLFRDQDRIFLRDRHSELGTLVNGRALGRDFPVDQVALQPGENTVIAGGDGSPYKFLIEV